MTALRILGMLAAAGAAVALVAACVFIIWYTFNHLDE